MKVCPTCLRLRVKGEWVPSNLENACKFIEHSVKIKKIKEPQILVTPVKPLDDGALLKLTVKGILGGEEIIIEKDIQLTYEKKQCIICARKQSKYYRVLMQLRPKDENTELKRLKRVFRFVRNKNREHALRDRDAEIFRFRLSKDGIDVFLGSIKAASKIIPKLRSTFDAEVKKSTTLVGVDKNGHNEYRTTFSIRV